MRIGCLKVADRDPLPTIDGIRLIMPETLREDMHDNEYAVLIECDEDGRYVATCPALQGCYTEGEREEEAREMIRDAIRLHVDRKSGRQQGNLTNDRTD